MEWRSDVPFNSGREGATVQGLTSPSCMDGPREDLSSLSVSGNLYLKNGLALSPPVACVCHSS